MLKGVVAMLQRIGYINNKQHLPRLVNNYIDSFINQNASPRSNKMLYRYTNTGFPIDMYSDKENLYVTAQLPGAQKDKINVEIVKNNLYIELADSDEEHNNRSYLIKEIPSTESRRVIKIPQEIMSKDVKSSYKDGILKVTLPISDPEPRQQIPVN